jgi:hypothetical protein
VRANNVELSAIENEDVGSLENTLASTMTNKQSVAEVGEDQNAAVNQQLNNTSTLAI